MTVHGDGYSQRIKTTFWYVATFPVRTPARLTPVSAPPLGLRKYSKFSQTASGEWALQSQCDVYCADDADAASRLVRAVFVCADRTFVATLYTSDSDKIMRYTDEVGH